MERERAERVTCAADARRNAAPAREAPKPGWAPATRERLLGALRTLSMTSSDIIDTPA